MAAYHTSHHLPLDSSQSCSRASRPGAPHYAGCVLFHWIGLARSWWDRSDETELRVCFERRKAMEQPVARVVNATVTLARRRKNNYKKPALTRMQRPTPALLL